MYVSMILAVHLDRRIADGVYGFGFGEQLLKRGTRVFGLPQ